MQYILHNVTFILLLIIFFFGDPTSGTAQQNLSQVPLEMRNKPWLDNEKQLIWDHTVTMLSGQKFTRYKHMNVGEFTTVGYQSLDQILDSLERKAWKESWTEQKVIEKTRYYTENAPGGRLMFFISRYDESQANTRWYFVILRDSADRKILEKDLDYQAPNNPEGLGWWNYYEFLIGKNIELPFYVYLNNKTSDHLTDFRFLISTSVE
jgi:hypothetical protein